MDQRDRQRRVLDLAREQGRVSVSELATTLGVSVETARRDLAALESHGLLQRAYGVAYPTETAAFESDLVHRETAHHGEKRLIAAEAARHLDDAESIFVDEGYTPQLLAEHLPDRPLTIVTASLPLAAGLGERPGVTVYVLGGRLRGRTMGTVGQWVTDMLGGFVLDLAIVGANSISRRHGLTTPDPAVAEVKRAAMRAARRTIFIGVSAKFTTASFCRFGDVRDLDMIITDRRLPAGEARQLGALGPTVVRV